MWDRRAPVMASNWTKRSNGMAGCMLLGNSGTGTARHSQSTPQLSQYWLLDRLPVIPSVQTRSGTMTPNTDISLKGDFQVIFRSSTSITVLAFIFPPAVFQSMPHEAVVFLQMSPIFHCFRQAKVSLTNLQAEKWETWTSSGCKVSDREILR